MKKRLITTCAVTLIAALLSSGAYASENLSALIQRATGSELTELQNALDNSGIIRSRTGVMVTTDEKGDNVQNTAVSNSNIKAENAVRVFDIKMADGMTSITDLLDKENERWLLVTEIRGDLCYIYIRRGENLATATERINALNVSEKEKERMIANAAEKEGKWYVYQLSTPSSNGGSRYTLFNMKSIANILEESNISGVTAIEYIRISNCNMYALWVQTAEGEYIIPYVTGEQFVDMVSHQVYPLSYAAEQSAHSVERMLEWYEKAEQEDVDIPNDEVIETKDKLIPETDTKNENKQEQVKETKDDTAKKDETKETVKDEPKTDVTPADKTETKSEDKTESKEDTKSETKSETQPEEKADAPLPSQPAKKEFVDVPATHRAYDGITELADNGVLSGYEDGTFRPGAYVTRAEMSRIISSVTGGLTAETPDSAECDFSDVNTGYWAMNDIIRCKALDLIDGYGDGTFKPNENVSVAEAAKICLSAAGYSSLITENSDTWYTPWIDMAVKYKILDSSDIDPNSKMTRADVAELVSKTINLPLCVFAGYDTSAGAKYQFADGTDGGELRTLLTIYLKK